MVSVEDGGAPEDPVADTPEFVPSAAADDGGTADDVDAAVAAGSVEEFVGMESPASFVVGSEEEGGSGARCEGGGRIWPTVTTSPSVPSTTVPATDDTGVGCIGGRAETAAAKAEADTVEPERRRGSSPACVSAALVFAPSSTSSSDKTDAPSSWCSLSCVERVVSWGVK